MKRAALQLKGCEFLLMLCFILMGGHAGFPSIAALCGAAPALWTQTVCTYFSFFSLSVSRVNRNWSSFRTDGSLSRIKLHLCVRVKRWWRWHCSLKPLHIAVVLWPPALLFLSLHFQCCRFMFHQRALQLVCVTWLCLHMSSDPFKQSKQRMCVFSTWTESALKKHTAVTWVMSCCESFCIADSESGL